MKKYTKYLFVAIFALFLTACSNSEKPLSVKTFGEIMQAEGYEIILEEDDQTSISVALNDETNAMFFKGKDTTTASAFYQTLAATLKQQSAEISEAQVEEDLQDTHGELTVTTTNDASYSKLIWHDSRVVFVTTEAEDAAGKSQAVLEKIDFKALEK